MLNTDRLCMGCMNDIGGEAVCSICGWDSANRNDADKLPVKFALSDRYIVGRVLKSNPESTVYMGWDNATDTAVNIREYFPSAAAIRNPDKTVSMVSGMEYVFNEGLMSFMEINKKLIGLELPSLIPTLSVFEDNGTVYSISAAHTGITLQSFLERNGGNLKWEQVRALFLPLIDTVQGLHEIKILHGGISPETIVVGRDGRLRLTDICIPRLRAVSSDTATELYSGYAAAEQYGIEDLSVDEYTDVYGLSATLFRVLIGKTPPPANERIEADTLTIPAHFADELPRQVLVATANGMQVRPEARSQSVEVYKNELVYGETQENARRAAQSRKVEEKAAKVAQKENGKSGSKNSGAKYLAISTVATLLIFAVIGVTLCFTVFREQLFGPKTPVSTNSDDAPSVPEINQVGDVDSDYVENIITYEVPNFVGLKYKDIIEDADDKYERFKISVADKKFSEKYPRGTVCSQSLEAGTAVVNKTEITLVVSLGPSTVKVRSVKGHTKDEALLELLKQGFMYENIEFIDKYDSDADPGVVLEQTPKSGESVGIESVIEIYINSYEGDEDDSSSNQTFFNNN